MASNACKQELLRRLGLAGTWMSRADLAPELAWSEARVDDELADLVLAEAVQFNERARLYRLAGAPVARLAVRQMLLGRDVVHRQVVARQGADKKTYHVGIAMRCNSGTPDEHIVMAEVAMDYPAGDLDALERITGQLTAALTAAVTEGAA